VKAVAAAPPSERARPARAPTTAPARGSDDPVALAFATSDGRALQRRLEIGAADDPLEREADRVADRVLRRCSCGGVPGGDGECADCKAQRLQLSRATAVPSAAIAPPSVHHTLATPGRPLDARSRSYFEPRLGADLSTVRVHDDATAAASAHAVGANAYAVGADIVFAAGKHAPGTPHGDRLLAHELAHVLQQRGGGPTVVQRDCSDASFCTPYPTPAEAASAKATLRAVYLPADEIKFGANSRALYDSFLSRHPGDSLAPVLFDNPSTDVVQSFATSSATDSDQDDVIDLIGGRLSGVSLSDYTPTTMSVSSFLSRTEMDNRPINYSNPFSIAGHIAGGIGSSDAGPDYRKIEWGNVMLERDPLALGHGYTSVETTLHYEVFDAVDFCPGDCGSPAEQIVTIPMSRLEAGGDAYDVPFKVKFVPESRSKRFWF